MTKLTIITINYNNSTGLQKTMESVLAQTSRDFEYIIVDGGSTDSSIEIIERLAINDKCLFKWVSESDSGIYNAMNKGIRMAKGDYVQFLNSGDILAANDVTEQMLKDMPECGVLSGDMRLISDGKPVKWKAPRTNNISFMTLYSGAINHSPSYIKRDLFEKYGYYDETLKIVSDWKFFLIAIGIHSEKIVLKNLTVTKFDLSGISSVNLDLREKERRLVLEEYVPHYILKDYDEFAVHYKKIKRLNQNHFLSLIINFVYRILSKYDKMKYSLIKHFK